MGFLYCIAYACDIIRKSFLKNNSKIIFLFVCLYYLCFSKLDKSSLVFSPQK